jgi:hypothetical protein
MMNVIMAKSAIECELLDKGFSHIKFPQSKNVQEILLSLGQVIQKTEIRENPRSTRLLSSNHGMSFHTDHNAAKYIAWFCNNQSAAGGESLLVDSKKIFQNFSESSLMLLQEISIKTHQVFYDDKLSIPLLSFNESEQNSVYYAQWLVNTPACIKHQKALEKFEQEIKSATPIKLLLSEGDLLIIDNQRMLHGREGFPSRSNRWLTRYWLKSSNINIH